MSRNGGFDKLMLMSSHHFLRWRILLRIRRSSPHFTTSFASSTTGHTFSSGGIGIDRVRAERNRESNRS